MCEWGVTGDCLESRQRCAEEWRTFWFKGIPVCLWMWCVRVWCFALISHGIFCGLCGMVRQSLNWTGESRWMARIRPWECEPAGNSGGLGLSQGVWIDLIWASMDPEFPMTSQIHHSSYQVRHYMMLIIECRAPSHHHLCWIGGAMPLAFTEEHY